MTNVVSFTSAKADRDDSDRVEQAEITAGWFFDQATKAQKAEWNATLHSLLGMTGPKWDRLRDAARAKWNADTQEARQLFDESVECILSHGEISEELDAKWSALCAMEFVRQFMAAE